ARATLDAATIEMSALSENLEPSLTLLADVLLRPRFDDKEIERVRGTWIATLRLEKANPAALSRRLVRPLLFGDQHPYAVAPSGNGTESAIAALKRDQLTAWAKAKLRPDLATVIVVGDTTLAEIQPKLEKALAAWKAPGAALAAPAIPNVKLPAKPRIFLVDQPGGIQANIVVSQAVPPSSDPKALDFEIANSVFGGEFSSRLNMNLRENKHWSYGAFSGVPDAIGQRTWGAAAGVQIDKTVDSIKEIHKEITELVRSIRPATAAEVSKIQSLEVRALPGAYETARAVANTIFEIVMLGRPDDWPAQRVRRIQGMTPAQVNTAAKTLRADSLTWVVVGDLKKIEAGIRALKLGEVKVLDADGKVLR
ncbi:MAG TPA: pitrilysin family protein, partial [Kofleriaceae bacterium]